MTNDEVVMATHLAACRFVPGTAVKRFARDMAFQASHEAGLERSLTEKQAKYLRDSVIRFRRQIPPEVVELARKVTA